LRTDGHGAIRAAKGLLVTTEARPNAQAHITDMGETIVRLTQARDLHEGMSEIAQQAKAHEPGDQDAVTKVVKEQNDAIKGRGNNRREGQFRNWTNPTWCSPARQAFTAPPARQRTLQASRTTR
jgi:type VI secretion system secreted protein VgrG